MTYNFDCPNCGGDNTYTGEEKTVRCTFCGSEVPVPVEVVNAANAKKIGSKLTIWIAVFIVVVFVIPACVGFGGAIIGFLATIFSTIVTIFASFFGH
jgi:hypothetical protein